MVASFPVKIMKWANDPDEPCVEWHRMNGQYFLLIQSKQRFCELYGNIAARWQRQFRNYEFVKYNPSNPLFVKGYAYMYSHPLFSPKMTEEEAKLMRCTLLQSHVAPAPELDTDFRFDLSMWAEAFSKKRQHDEMKADCGTRWQTLCSAGASVTKTITLPPHLDID